MEYVSTRGEAPHLDFEGALMAGLAADGGLYVPARWPKLSHKDVAGLGTLDYQSVAVGVLAPFVEPSITRARLAEIVAETYKDFRHVAVTPLVEIAPAEWLLELFHGPTLAFKDLAMQLLGRLFEEILARRGEQVTLIGATSGDTGSAAIEAMRGRTGVKIFILHPKGRVSEVQRRQMTSVIAANVFNLAIEGTFDDCQRIVKSLFVDPAVREPLRLSGVNSINWARVVAQIVYYFSAAVALGAPHRAVQFSVPTGNFGDVYAGYIAKQMGLPISRLTVATNVNDILVRTLQTGRYEVNSVTATMSPSIDIQVSSNFERLLHDVEWRNAARVRTHMAGLAQSGAFQIEPRVLTRITKDFAAARVDEAETAATMASVYAQSGEIIDPHTAVGVAAGRKRRLPGHTPLVHLATAHPAKFPDAVEKAIGIRPALPLHLADLYDREERVTVLPNDLIAVRSFLLENAA